MKIGIDLRPFMTGSRFRGIGIYAKGLISQLLIQMPDAEFHLLNMYGCFEDELPDHAHCYVHNYYTGPSIYDVGERQLFTDSRTISILEAQVKNFIKISNIDIMLFPSPNEYGNFFKAEWFEGVATVAILYDLIPLLFPNQCLYDKVTANDYNQSLIFLQSLDMLLAISQTTKDDAVKLLNIPEAQIHVIYAGIDAHFQRMAQVKPKSLKDKYKISDSFMMFAGGIDFKKNIGTILDAYSLLPVSIKKRYQFIIVGKTVQSEIDRYLAHAQNNGDEGRVICLGFVPTDDLVALYNITDLFIFPSLYEGFGLPVIEAMACGARVVTSNSSSLREIAENHATLVNPKSAKSIARGIQYVLDNPVQSLECACEAEEYAKSFTWRKVAKMACDAISGLTIKDLPAKPAYHFEVTDILLQDVASVYSQSKIPMGKYVANTLAQQFYILENQLEESINMPINRIIFDMTVVREWIKSNYSTGIGRVSLELFKQLKGLINVVPISMSMNSNDLVCQLIQESSMELKDNLVKPTAQDIYLMPEIQLRGVQIAENHPKANILRSHNIKCFAILYDLLPLTMPEYFEEKTANAFDGYVRELLANYDGIIADSKAVIDDLLAYFKANIRQSYYHPIKLGYFHPGMNSFNKIFDGEVPQEIRNFFDGLEYIFLMIGTVEPRKGHEFVLDAFDELWENGYNYKLCIMGHIGWNMDRFLKRLKIHPEYGGKIVFFEGTSDASIQYAYENSTALIQASAGEGFGLPLIEASIYNLPILCSDIPVFHEVTHNIALFFNRDDIQNLIDCISEFLSLEKEGMLPLSSSIPSLTWKQSTQIMSTMLLEDHGWYAEISKDGSVKYYFEGENK